MPLLDAIPIFGPWRIRRDEAKFRQWCAFIDTHRWGAEIIEITGVRQHARTGLKAYGRWLFPSADGSLKVGQYSALWIKQAWPGIGMFMSASGSWRPGKHHGEWVFYADQPYHFLDRQYFSAMRRHVARQNAQPQQTV